MHRMVGLLGLILAAALLGGCAERTHTDKTVIEWSRGKQVGLTNASEPVAMALDPGSGRMALAWPESPERGVQALHLVLLDRQGTVFVDRQLALAAGEPTTTRLVWTEDGHLHLTWIDTGQVTPSLRHVLLDAMGQPVSVPQALSDPDLRVNGQEIAALPGGGLLVVWSNRQGLVAARVAGDGAVLASVASDAPDSYTLDLVTDEAGLVHITWQQRPAPLDRTLSYAALEPASLTFSDPLRLDAVDLRAASSLGGSATELFGPAIALDREQVVIAWSVGEVRGSNDSAYYVRLDRIKDPADPQSQGLPTQPVLISLPPAYQPAYSPASGPLPYQQLAAALPPGSESQRAHLRSAPAPASGRAGETPLGAGVWVRTAWSSQLQPALVVLNEGEVKGFQIVGWSRYPSLYPNLIQDREDNLYLTWVDAAGKTLPVYLASTAPVYRAVGDRITTHDLRVGLERLLGRVVSAMGLLPFALSWLILPGACLIAALFVVREDSLDTTRGRGLLFLMIGAHWAGKFLFSPEILASLPRMSDLPQIFPLGALVFSGAWTYLPNEMQLPPLIAPIMAYVVPGLTLVAGAIVTRLAYLNRSAHPSLVPAYAILAAVDLFLSLQVYALAYFDPVSF